MGATQVAKVRPLGILPVLQKLYSAMIKQLCGPYINWSPGFQHFLNPVLDPALDPVLDVALDPVLNPALDPLLDRLLDQLVTRFSTFP